MAPPRRRGMKKKHSIIPVSLMASFVLVEWERIIRQQTMLEIKAATGKEGERRAIFQYHFCILRV